jgi:hypothetical protein
MVRFVERFAFKATSAPGIATIDHPDLFLSEENKALREL